MEKTFKIFHYLSFVQYPFLLLALYYCYKPLLFGMETMISDFNNGLLFLGIALSFTSLADIRKRTKIGDRIFGKPKNAKRWIAYVFFLVLAIFGLGIFIQFFSKSEDLKGLSIGVFVLGIGVVGLLRMNLEIIKSYQADWKNTNANKA